MKHIKKATLLGILLLSITACGPNRIYQLQCIDGRTSEPTLTSNWSTWIGRDNNIREPSYVVRGQGWYKPREGQLCQVYWRFVK